MYEVCSKSPGRGKKNLLSEKWWSIGKVRTTNDTVGWGKKAEIIGKIMCLKGGCSMGRVILRNLQKTPASREPTRESKVPVNTTKEWKQASRHLRMEGGLIRKRS